MSTEAEVDTEVAQETLELTDRELAIAKGLDPDAVEDVVSGGGDVGATDGAAGGTEAPDAGLDKAESWVTDDLRDLAKHYGLEEDDLKDFESEADLIRYARVQERKSAKKPAAPESTDMMSVEGAGKPEAEKPVAVKEEKKVRQKFDPKVLQDQGYDETTVAMGKSLREAQDENDALREEVEKLRSSVDEKLGRITPLAERLEEDRRKAFQEEFHREVDALGRYGIADKLTKEDDAKRERLYRTAILLGRRSMEAGDPPPPLRAVLKRAEIVEFGDELAAAKREEFAARVKDQSSRRRSVGRVAAGTKKTLPGDSDDPVRAIANSPELVQFWNERAIK